MCYRVVVSFRSRLLFTKLQLRKHRRIRVLFFDLFYWLRFVFGGFVYAIASAACEFLYRKNNEYYDIKKKKKKNNLIEGSSRNHLSTFPTTRYCNTILLLFTPTFYLFEVSKLLQTEQQDSTESRQKTLLLLHERRGITRSYWTRYLS